ncbi:potassium-transporting ATPase subunit KdpA [Roseivivax sediminis]|uniref:Potassium-transporting ATPase potassium-binding subunit n=1 Tax=Roseivivax sediminis TaxID=936889 RepID=A0A1I2EIK9_9RHOB|nr:potassium-transporting ATPase subunit KdpA [Roseivivax sediminis]SFE92467.1 K+-transporting ATPase ATPase A chain [Roseivivax sediminis]
MTPVLVTVLLYLTALVALAVPLGRHMARLYRGERTVLTPALAPVEKAIYRVASVRADESQSWRAYAVAVLAFNAAGFVFLYAVLRLQGLLPWNPAGIAPMAPDLAFNTAVSFVTNTNWQAYSGEVQLSYFSQMVGLTVQNFVSAATGMAVAIAVIRGFACRGEGRIGNFWTDLTRSVLYVLLPLAVIGALLLVSQGVVQNLSSYVTATTLEGVEQVLAQGPAASQIAIKQLGTNGGGYFGVNSAHPFENPTVLSNMLQSLYILLIPVAFCFTFGRMVGDHRQGIAIFAAMGVMFVAGLAVVAWSEAAGNPLVSQIVGSAGPNLEGKEMRFGATLSALWGTATTAASNGSVNAMHDSFMPLSGLVFLFNMMIGEVIFGGVGAGLYGMLLYVVLAVFLAGLMVGRTPEYLGKKIEAKEVSLAVLAFLSMPLGILVFAALSVVVPQALAAVQDAGPHGLSEVLYAYGSATGNNGSAFAGFGAADPFHTTLQGLAMLLGRYAIIVPMLGIAGALAAKIPAAPTAGTFPTHGPLFVVLLIVTVLILGGLTFFPALALGPLAEQVSLAAGTRF